LPDGVFSKQKYQFEQILLGPGIEKVGIFYGHLEYTAAIGMFYGHLVILFICYIL
jgi:hypothetical protein